MAEHEVTGDEPLAAGAFSAWLAGMTRALAGGGGGSDVPCGGCTACCQSSQFVHIGPEETETLRRIPSGLLFPAPRLPPGYVLLGYDENGHCPMLVDEGCSIYEHRPRTCRTYDCRVFAAAGVEIDDDDDQVAIGLQARRWRFDFPGDDDRVAHEAVRAAARYVRERQEMLPEAAAPANPTQHAVLAVRVHAAFLRPDEETGRATAVAEPDPEAIRVLLAPDPLPPTAAYGRRP